MSSLFGCTPPEVKNLAIQVHLATEEKQIVDEKVYELVTKLVQNNLNSVINQYKRQLEKEYWKMQLRIVESVDNTWLQQYKAEIDMLNDQFNVQITDADTKMKRLYTEAPNWPVDVSTETTAHLSEIHNSQIKAYQAHIDLLQKKYQLSSGYEKAVEENLIERNSAINELMKLNEDMYEQASSELARIEANVRKADTQLQEVLAQLLSMNKAISNGSLALRDYLLRKSELALFVGGLLKSLDLTPSVWKAETAAEEVMASIYGKLEGTLNSYILKASKLLDKVENNIDNL